MPRSSFRQICFYVLFLLVLFCAAGAREAAADLSLNGYVKDSFSNAVSGALIVKVGDPSVSATSGTDGGFHLDGLSQGVDFSLRISKDGYMDVYSSTMNSVIDLAPLPYVLYTSSEVLSWGVTPGKGVIASRVSEWYDPNVYIGGAVVSCTSSLNPLSCPYQIKYYDGTSVVASPSGTYGNGKYFVLDVYDNDTVTVTAAKSGKIFSTRKFLTHSDGVSEGRITTTPTGSVSGTVSYYGSRPGATYVALFSSPVITSDTVPMKAVQAGADGAYTISGVPDGTYYVGAVKTENLDAIQREDPYGMYGIDFVSDFTPDAVVISGSAVTGINITMVDGTAEHPNPFYPSQVVNDPLRVEVVCPASVQTGQPLNVNMILYNWDCYNSVSVDRFIMSVLGNANGTLSGLGIFGPYNKTLSTPKVVPAASCGETTTPGSVTPFSLTVMNPVPSSLSGKMSEVEITAITGTGQTVTGGTCMVNVP